MLSNAPNGFPKKPAILQNMNSRVLTTDPLKGQCSHKPILMCGENTDKAVVSLTVVVSFTQMFS